MFWDHVGMEDEALSRLAALHARLNEVGGVPECPAHPGAPIDHGSAPVVLPVAGTNPGGRALEVYPFFCRECGFVRFYATDYLENARKDDH
jgi:hypothetical protein